MRFQKNPNQNDDDEEELGVFGFKIDKDMLRKISSMTEKGIENDQNIAAMLEEISNKLGDNVSSSDVIDLIKEISMDIAKETAEVVEAVSKVCLKLVETMSLMGEDVSIITMPLDPSIHLWFKNGISSDTLYCNINEFTSDDGDDSRNRKDVYIEVYPRNGPQDFQKIIDSVFKSY